MTRGLVLPEDIGRDSGDADRDDAGAGAGDDDRDDAADDACDFAATAASFAAFAALIRFSTGPISHNLSRIASRNSVNDPSVLSVVISALVFIIYV